MTERAKMPSFPDRIHTREHLIELALHELNCVLVGYHLGYLGNISIKAKSEFLACVTFQGNIPLRCLQVVAVAGKISAQGLTQSYNSEVYVSISVFNNDNFF